jgi:FkbM family methyltransferase
MLRRLLSLPSRVQELSRRLEEAIAYFAGRSHPLHFTPNAYLGDHTSLTLLEGRIKIFVDTRGNDLSPHLLIDGRWEPNYTRLFERLIQPGDTVLDLGAHHGVYALLGAVATGPTGQVHAFEPNPHLAALLQRSLAVNGLTDRAAVHNVAVGAAEGSAELVFSWGWSGGGFVAVDNGALPAGYQRHRCRVVALDDLFRDPAFRVDVMKIDVEGTEARAMRGMVGLIGRSPRARIMFELAPQMLAGQGSSAAELIGIFTDLGFRFWAIGDDSALAAVDAGALATMQDGIRNILAARDQPTLRR